MEDFMPVRCMREQEIREYADFDIKVEIEHSYRADSLAREARKASGFYSPSNMNGCSRSLYYGRVQAEGRQTPSVSMSMNYDIGDAVHELLQTRLKKLAGFECERDVEFPALKIRGRVDGVFLKYDWIIEIKTISDTQYKTLVKPKLPHIWQIHCYMWCMDIPRAQILYVNKSNGDMRVFRVRFQDKVWTEITEKLAVVEGHVKTKEPPDREGSKWICGECRFFGECKPTFGVEVPDD